jgi:glucose/arabinose dehydrogenase
LSYRIGHHQISTSVPSSRTRSGGMRKNSGGRVAMRGTAPTDNPFFAAGAAMGGEVGANIQKVYSYGHGNGFGMAFDPYSGSLWETENADDACSELNRHTTPQHHLQPMSAPASGRH